MNPQCIPAASFIIVKMNSEKSNYKDRRFDDHQCFQRRKIQILNAALNSKKLLFQTQNNSCRKCQASSAPKNSMLMNPDFNCNASGLCTSTPKRRRVSVHFGDILADSARSQAV